VMGKKGLKAKEINQMVEEPLEVKQLFPNHVYMYVSLTFVNLKRRHFFATPWLLVLL
jgi:hypothetical protein